MSKKGPIKNNLHKYRKWKNIKQIDLTDILGISISHLRDIEKNHIYPKYHIRSRICNYFNVNPNQMFYKKDE